MKLSKKTNETHENEVKTQRNPVKQCITRQDSV